MSRATRCERDTAAVRAERGRDVVRPPPDRDPVRRAASAKRYRTQHGVAATRIETVSFGEERPAATGTDEASMAQNRRSEFEIIAGGDNITVPSGE